MSDIPFRFKNRTSQVTGFIPDATGICDGEFFIQQADKAILFKDVDGNLVQVKNVQTGSFITTSQTGSFGGGNVDLSSYVTTGQTGSYLTCSSQILASTGTNTITADSTVVTFIASSSGVCISGAARSSSIISSQSSFICNGCYNSIISSCSSNICLTNNYANIIGSHASQIASNSNCSNVVGSISSSLHSANNSSIFGSTSSRVCSTVGFATIVGGCNNAICSSSNFGALIGGACNCMITTTSNSIVAGGFCNSISSSSCSIIVGGTGLCIISAQRSANIAGGANRINGASNSALLGGCSNLMIGANVQNSAIIGGSGNFITGDSVAPRGLSSAIIGGTLNFICTGATNSIILGGQSITGSVCNTVYGSNFCAVGGKYFGDGSSLTGLATGTFITTSQTGAFGGGGGTSDLSALTGSTNYISGASNTIIIGGCNSKIESSTDTMIIGSVCSTGYMSTRSLIIGGACNALTLMNSDMVIVGGIFNCFNNYPANRSVILGGSGIEANASNTVFGNNFCAVTGKFFGDGSALTGLATGTFVTTANTGSFVTSCSIATGFIKNINSTSVTTPTSPQTNTAISSNVAIVCGSYTTAIASQCTTLCGSYNAAIAMGGTTFSTVYGGVVNSVLSAGSTNSIYGSCSSIIAGNNNVINGPGNVITSSYLSTACITSSYSFISSSYNSYVCVTSYGSILSSANSFIRGSSYSNLLGSSSSAICLATLSSIIGGNNNELRGTGNSILGSIFSNITGTCNSAIIGGSGNCITGLNSAGINSVILGGSAIIANCPNTAYANNFCSFNGKYYGDASALTGLATGSFITTGQTGTVFINNLCVTGGYISVGAIEENFTTCVGGASGLINFDVCSAATMYYVNNSTANFYLNLRSNSSTTLNSILDINKTLTVTFLNTNGSTAYPLTGIAIDGSGRSIRWLNGTGSYPASNTGSIDTYSITAVKTGDNLYTVLGSQGKFV